MNNNLSEIKILISGLMQDIESVENTEILPLYKWEDIMISIDIIKNKLNTYKSEYDREMLREINEHIALLTTSGSAKRGKSAGLATSEQQPEPGNLFAPYDSFHSAPEDSEVIEKLSEEPEEQIDEIEEIEDTEETIDTVEKVDTAEEDYFTEGTIVEHADEPFELFTDTNETILDVAIKSKPSWKSDYPGSKITDIGTAISLNDRLLFLNQLFYGDVDQYRLSIARLNEMRNFDEALDYLRAAFPSWDENSDTVYRFYMIIRRKLDV